MNLGQMNRSKKGATIAFRSPIADRKGQSNYEVLVTGPKGVVEKSLGQADLKFEIDPDATKDEMERRAMKILEPYHEQLAMLARGSSPAKTPSTKLKISAPQPSRTITLSLNAAAPHGTFWFFDSVIPIPLPGATTFQVIFPPCFAGGAMSIPAAGNPNIFIRFNSPTAVISAASVAPGLAVDTAPFSVPPWVHVIPFFQFVHAAPVTTRMICWGLSLLPF
jgi:hypothetical protein